MTTVAYRDGILASDSKLTAHSTYVGDFEKVMKVTYIENLSLFGKLTRRKPEEVTYLVGCCGNVGDIQDHLDLLFNNGPPLAESEHTNCLIVTIEEGSNEILVYENGSTSGMKINSKYYAMGSGSEIALGALYQGATAEEAVEAAIYHDNTSGGAIQKVMFD